MVDDVEENHPLIKIPREIKVPRKSSELANSIELLLFTSKKIKLVDPYFDISKPKFQKPLHEFLKKLICLINLN